MELNVLQTLHGVGEGRNEGQGEGRRMAALPPAYKLNFIANIGPFAL